jgi:hypothetical protein
MKKEKLSYATITVAEVWITSVQLRNVERILSSSNYHCEKGLILQQLHTSNLGNREWRDVPTETES